jgi:hypothetical protein
MTAELVEKVLEEGAHGIERRRKQRERLAAGFETDD